MKHGNNFQDLTGKKFGKLTVLKMNDERIHKEIQWECKCDCGNENIINVRGHNLRDGSIKNCGCERKKGSITTVKNNEFYINDDSPFKEKLYHVWKGICHRCCNPKDKHYIWYGERGITICNEWRNDENGFHNFYYWAINNGYEVGLSIDRIDVNGNYESNNCKWSTDIEQCNNKRDNILVTYNNKTLTIHQWMKELDLKVDYDVIRLRWYNGIRGKALFEQTSKTKSFTDFSINIDGKIKIAKEWYTQYDISRTQFKRRYENGITGKDLIKPTNKELATDLINTIFININGENLTLKEIGLKYNIKAETIKDRYLRGCTPDQIIKPIPSKENNKAC